MDRVVASDLEKERLTAIFVMQNFVPEEQRAKVDLEFIRLQLRRSSLQMRAGKYTKSPTEQLPASTDGVTEDENTTCEDWQDLMQWSNPSLLDMIELRQVHLFQWQRTHKYLTDLYNGLRGTMDGTSNLSTLEWQRNEINKCIHIIRGMRNGADQNHNHHPGTGTKSMNVFWIIWKLRGFLATIPTPATKTASFTAHVRLKKFHEELGIASFAKLSQWIYKNPDQYLLYLATVCWFPHSTQNVPLVRQ